MSRTLLLRPDESKHFVVDEAVSVIRAGGIIVYPTETLYGIGANALDVRAVERILAAKKRKENRPILAIIHSQEQLNLLAARISPPAQKLMDEFWPGPLTIVFAAQPGLPHALTQSSGTIGIRIPSNAFCLELLRRCGCPLTSTSANLSGEPVHRTIEEIKNALSEGIDLFVDAGPLPKTSPSTVVSVVEPIPKLIRKGVVSLEELHRVLPQIAM